MNFMITVDTEGDNLWQIKRCSSGVATITNKNGAYIERFQVLCEKYNLIPTYFVNYEMTLSKAFVEVGREAVKKQRCEIGMHMHAWNSPPVRKLPEAKGRKYGKPYAGEYPQEILYAKMQYLHEKLEEVFGVPITSHRGGRWYFDEKILGFLIKNHYLADATITPGITWENMYGNRIAGCDYKKVKMNPYELDHHNILKAGKSGVVEVPPTIMTLPPCELNDKGIIQKCHRTKQRYWIRPNGNNLKEILLVMNRAYRQKKDYIQFMIHSSELMPGGSPTFRTERSIEQLYYDLEIIFSIAAKYCRGIGITDYAKKYVTKKNQKGRI